MHYILPRTRSSRCELSLNAEGRTRKSDHMSAICICTCQQLCFGINTFEVRINSAWKISQGIAHRPKQNGKSDSLETEHKLFLTKHSVLSQPERKMVATTRVWGHRDKENVFTQVEKCSSQNNCLFYNPNENHSWTTKKLQLRKSNFSIYNLSQNSIT